jgi:anti-sigma factor ChrR (cupin superfamily)
MSRTNQDRAGEYVLGVLSADEREALARIAETDASLAHEIALWDERLAPLLLDTPEAEPPPHLFERIKAKIATREPKPTAPKTVRAGEGRWETIAPGVERKVLRFDKARQRVTFLVRGAPGARFPSHAHDDDEECYVLSGDLSFGPLTLRAGDYHLAVPGVAHPVGTTAGGCMLLMMAAA